MWDAKAEAANTALSKGMEVVVFGKLITHEYQAKDGTNRSSIEVKAQDVFTIVKPAPGQQPQAHGQQQGGWATSAGNSWTPQGADSDEPPF
jgi:single-strand DNA-binding protein